MPIYEYRCAKCEEDFECLVFRSDEAVSCPTCDGEKVERLMSSCSFKTGGDNPSPVSSGSGCSSCAGGHCSTCH